MVLRFTPVFWRNITLFLYMAKWYSTVCTDHNLFIHLPVSELKVWGFVNKAALYILVLVFGGHVSIPLGQIPRVGLPGQHRFGSGARKKPCDLCRSGPPQPVERQ